jgi:putative membrane protein
MKRWATLGSALTLALAVTACAGDNATENTANTPNAARDNAAVGTSGNTNLAADADFIREHVAMGESEVALGRLAAQKGTHAEVKRFGEMMVRDHTAAGQELKQIHSQLAATNAENRTTTDTDARDDHKDALEDLQGLSGREFDQKYMDLMVDHHEKAVNELERRAENGSTEVRQWAAKTLPKVQQHLEQAKTIKETLDKGN